MPRRDYSRWPHSENRSNLLDLCTLLKSYVGSTEGSGDSSHLRDVYPGLQPSKCGHMSNAAPYTTTRLFTLTSLRKLIELIRSLHTFEFPPQPLVRQYRQFPLPRRIPWTTAVGNWSHIKSRLHTPRRDFSRWPHSQCWSNWLDLYTLLKFYVDYT